MKEAIDRVFTAEVLRNKSLGADRHRYFLMDSAPAFTNRFGKGTIYNCRGAASWRRVFEQATRASTWISTTANQVQRLLRAASEFLAGRHGSKPVLGDLLMLETPGIESLPGLRSLFRNVVGEAGALQLLPGDELAEVLLAPEDEARDLFIGVLYDPASATLSLTRGNLETVVVPRSLFRPSGTSVPNPASPSVTDYGHTIKLGNYEASADSNLFEVDPSYRRWPNARRQREENGFGPALRRLRIQRRLNRTDFPESIPRPLRAWRGVKPENRTARR